ncbi:MAG: MFS transporter, partial [Actinomycetes bacterium]
ASARPVHFAALPDLTRAEPEQLVSATSLSSVIDGSVRFLGPVLAGVAVASIGPASAMLTGAALGALAVALCLRLHLPRAPRGEADEASTLRAALAGLRTLRRSPASFMLLVVMGLDFVLTGTVDILGVAFAESVLGDTGTAAGLVVGAMGIGALVGAAVSGPLAQGRWLTGVIVIGTVLEGLLFASTGAWDKLLPVVVILAVAGIGGAVTTVAGRTLLQRTTDDEVLARVFAVQESVALLGLALGAALAPVLVSTVGVQWAWIPLGVAVAAIGLLSIGPLRSLDLRARWLPVELHLLRGLPFISALPPYGLERLAHEATWTPFRAGEVIAAEGQHGDALGILGDGEASAWVDGRRRPGVLGSGGWFGEESLLRGESQSATVIAETHGRLLTVTQASFRRAAGDERSGVTS